MTPIDVFAKIYDLPPGVRNRLLGAGIPRVIPIAGGLKIRIDELELDGDDPHAITTMPFVRRARNHVGSMYIGALIVQAEATMATLVVGQCRPPAFRVLVKRSEADFVSRASTPVRGIMRPNDEERAALAKCRALGPGEKGEAWTTVRLETRPEDTNGTAQHVCTMRFLLSIKRN